MNVRDVIGSLQNMGGLIPSLGIEFGGEGEDITCRMHITRAHTGAPGVAHGGAVTALMDTALGGRALMHALPRGRATSTVEIKVNFLRPAREGQTLITRTAVQHAGKSLLVISGSAVDEATDKQIAFAVGTFNLYEDDMAEKFIAAASRSSSPDNG
ncbi:MAG: PaaI family thioesterase [Myxococcota bacterium]